MTWVVDASVALKWFLHNHPDEADTPAALDILAGHAQGRIALLQPPHFLAEVCAVLACWRRKPCTTTCRTCWTCPFPPETTAPSTPGPCS